jgi:hypothetical protein
MPQQDYFQPVLRSSAADSILWHVPSNGLDPPECEAASGVVTVPASNSPLPQATGSARGNAAYIACRRLREPGGGDVPSAEGGGGVFQAEG